MPGFPSAARQEIGARAAIKASKPCARLDILMFLAREVLAACSPALHDLILFCTAALRYRSANMDSDQVHDDAPAHFLAYISCIQ